MQRITRQSLESEMDKLLNKYGIAIVKDFGDGRHKNVTHVTEYYPQAKTALLKTVDRYVEERERVARVDELEKVRTALDLGANTLEARNGAYIADRLAELKALRQQVKGASRE